MVRRLFELWLEGRLDDIRVAVAEDLEWLEPPEAPDRHIVTGRDAALQAVTEWVANWADYAIELREVIESRDRVLAVLRQRTEGAGSGVSVESDLFMVWSFRDGVPARMEMYINRAQAEAAAQGPVTGSQQSGDFCL